MDDAAPFKPSQAGADYARIVHPTDFSPEGDIAFAHALRLAVASRGQLQILHADNAIGLAGREWAAFPRVRPTLERWGLIAPGQPQTAVSEQLGVNVLKTDLGAAVSADAVIGYLQAHPADLVVMATNARGGLERWARPSRAEPIGREARLPTLFLPTRARGFVDPATGKANLKRILVPVDEAPDPMRAVSMAAAISRSLGGAAKIDILHVGEDFGPDVYAPKDLDVERMSATGPVVEAILDAAERTDADLIAMTTRGHDGFLDALRGSTTEQVLRRAARAVLAVPA